MKSKIFWKKYNNAHKKYNTFQKEIQRNSERSKKYMQIYNKLTINLFVLFFLKKKLNFCKYFPYFLHCKKNTADNCALQEILQKIAKKTGKNLWLIYERSVL